LNLALASISAADRSIENSPGCLPDIRPCAVPFNERNDGTVRNDEPSVPELNLLS